MEARPHPAEEPYRIYGPVRRYTRKPGRPRKYVQVKTRKRGKKKATNADRL
jgi:hypothetical protein